MLFSNLDDLMLIGWRWADTRCLFLQNRSTTRCAIPTLRHYRKDRP
jgi:hypothetical protein